MADLIIVHVLPEKTETLINRDFIVCAESLENDRAGGSSVTLSTGKTIEVGEGLNALRTKK